MFLGNDIVYIPGFKEQLESPGSYFIENFSPSEILDARQSVHGFEMSLAGKWAAKESFIKAWSQIYFTKSPPFSEEKFKFKFVEVVKDSYNRPSLRFHKDIANYLKDYLIQVSISHDYEYALSTVLIYEHTR